MPKLTHSRAHLPRFRADLTVLDSYEGQRLRFEGKVQYERRKGVWLIEDLAIMQFKELGGEARIQVDSVHLGISNVEIRTHHLIRGERIAFDARVKNRKLQYVTGIWQPDDYDRPTR